MKHPFQRVPTLVHDEFILYGTSTIRRSIDETFPGIALKPATNHARARMAQIIGIIDSYGYWPMVKQVFSHRVFRPRTGQVMDERGVTAGTAAPERVLGALEPLVADGTFLVTSQLTLADLHLAPMKAYFSAATEGRTALSRQSKLSKWWDLTQSRTAFAETIPVLPG